MGKKREKREEKTKPQRKTKAAFQRKAKEREIDR
jgi:hypothetical protein